MIKRQRSHVMQYGSSPESSEILLSSELRFGHRFILTPWYSAIDKVYEPAQGPKNSCAVDPRLPKRCDEKVFDPVNSDHSLTDRSQRQQGQMEVHVDHGRVAATLTSRSCAGKPCESSACQLTCGAHHQPEDHLLLLLFFLPTPKLRLYTFVLIPTL